MGDLDRTLILRIPTEFVDVYFLLYMDHVNINIS